MTGLFDHFVDQLEVSRFLAAIPEIDFSCIHASEKNKHARWIQLKVSVTDHKCGIGISSIFDTAYRYFFLFFFFFFFGSAVFGKPQCPPLQLVNLREVIIIGLWLGKNFGVLDI